MRPQEEFAFPSIHEIAAIRVRVNRGITIRERVFEAAEACVKVRLEEKHLVARCLDSGEGGKGVAGSPEDLQGAGKFGLRLRGSEFHGPSEGDLRIRRSAEGEQCAARRQPTTGV